MRVHPSKSDGGPNRREPEYCKKNKRFSVYIGEGYGRGAVRRAERSEVPTVRVAWNSPLRIKFCLKNKKKLT
jgi:hypothetical protein